MMRKIIILFIFIIILVPFASASEKQIKWNIKSVTGTGEKCPPMNAVMPGYTVTDYAAVLITGDTASVTTCGTGTAEVVLESDAFTLNTDDSFFTIDMHLPIISGATYFLGVDGLFWKQLQNGWWKTTGEDCIKDAKANGDTVIFSPYDYSTAQWSDNKPHKLSLKIVKESADCLVLMNTRGIIKTTSTGTVITEPTTTETAIPDSDSEVPSNEFGCTDENAFNYNSEATTDDGSCNDCPYGSRKVNLRTNAYYLTSDVSYCTTNSSRSVCGSDYSLSLTERFFGMFSKTAKQEAIEKANAELKERLTKPAGEITFKKGRVLIERGIDIIPGRVGTKLKFGDTVVVEEGAEAAISLDSGLIKVTQKTKYMIPIPESYNSDTSLFSLALGKTWCEAKEILKGNSFEIKTPSGGGGVRG